MRSERGENFIDYSKLKGRPLCPNIVKRRFFGIQDNQYYLIVEVSNGKSGKNEIRGEIELVIDESKIDDENYITNEAIKIFKEKLVQEMRSRVDNNT